MRYSFVLLGLLAFVCATSGYVLKDQDDALGDTDDHPERVAFKDNDRDCHSDSHSHEHSHHRHTTTTTAATTTTPPPN